MQSFPFRIFDKIVHQLHYCRQVKGVLFACSSYVDCHQNVSRYEASEQQRPPLQVIALKIVRNEWLDPFSARKSIVHSSSLSLFSRGGQSLSLKKNSNCNFF